jgi:carbon storage regulator
MLVISCREGESISIGEEVEVTVLAAGPGKVKLGFKAPLSVPVARRCMELTRRQNQAAAHDTHSSLVDELASFLNGNEANNPPYVLSLSPTPDSVRDSKKFSDEIENGYKSQASR